MNKTTKMQKVGMALVVLSPFVGLVGTAVCVYLSFSALETAENAGIGAAGDQIRNALLFSAGGIVGSGIGLALIVLGRPGTPAD